MGKRRRQKQKRNRNQQRSEALRKLTTKQRWMIVVVALLFGLSLVPYAMDLAENPDSGNAVLLVTIAGAFIAMVAVILKYH